MILIFPVISQTHNNMLDFETYRDFFKIPMVSYFLFLHLTNLSHVSFIFQAFFV